MLKKEFESKLSSLNEKFSEMTLPNGKTSPVKDLLEAVKGKGPKTLHELINSPIS